MSSKHWKSITAVVVDAFRTDQRAIVKAAAIAERCGARLTLLETFMLPQPTPEALFDSTKQMVAVSTRLRLEQLESLAARLTPRNIIVQCAVEWDYPAHEAIVRHVLEQEPDLLVAESHHHGRIARWVLANTDWELIRSCPCPLWFVRSASLPVRPRVLVAVDPRHMHEKPARLDERLLAAAVGMTSQLQGEIDVVHAYPRRSAREFAAETRKQVKQLAARYGVGPQRCFVRQGETTDVLTTLTAKRKTDVVVMGAISRSSRARPVIGNTAEKAIDHIDCDVFVVKPAGFKTPVLRRRPEL